MTTVLLMPGSFSLGNVSTLMAAFQGGPQALLTQMGDTTTAVNVNVGYNDWDAWSGYQDGANKLNTAILAADPTHNIVCFGHSYGAVSMVQWLRQYGPTCTVSPNRMKFVLIGNSVRAGPAGGTPNGLCAQWSMYGGVGPATTSRYLVYDCARQWDKWADYPNVNSSPYVWNAANNVNYGDSTPDQIHISYQNINFTKPDASLTVGNVTYMLFRCPDIPLPAWAGGNRGQLEQAYNRVIPGVGF